MYTYSMSVATRCIASVGLCFVSSDRLSAQDILTIKKVMEYLYSKVYGEDGLADGKGLKVDCTECFEVFCNNQVGITVACCPTQNLLFLL